MKFILSLLVLITLAPGLSAQTPKEKDKKAILGIMERQEACWNAGDLECFMNGYWESEDLKFIGKSGITYGWQATLDRYKRGYPTKADMGKLTFEILHVDGISKKSVLVVGKWSLKRTKDDLEGHFSLVWKKIGGEWVIVTDHSS